MKTIILSLTILILFSTIIYSQYEFRDRNPQTFYLEKHQPELDTQLGNIDEAMLDSIIFSTMETSHIPGTQALIVKHDEIVWSKNYGYANVEQNKPVEDSTLFLICSVSKTIVATAIMQFWEADSFDLDDNINDYLDDFQVINPRYSNDSITFRMLMMHTSGIQDNYYDVFDSLTVCGDSPVPLDSLLINYFTPGAIYNYPENFNSWAPGTWFNYSNFGVCLLAYFVEKFSGNSFEQYCRENIFNPLGMGSTTTSYLLAGLDTTSLATPYLWDNNQYNPYCQYGGPFFPVGQLRTNKIDLEHFMSAYMNWGTYNGYTILDSSTVDLILTDHLGHLDPEYGYIQGLILYRTAEVSNNFWPWGHGGAWNGARAKMFFQQDEGWGVMYFINSRPSDGIASYLLDIICYYAHLYGHIYALNTNTNKPYLIPFVETIKITTNFSNMNQHNFTANAIYISSDSSFIDSIALYDDGLHGDKLANDGLWCGYIYPLSEEKIFKVGISTKDLETGEYFYTGDQTRFTTAGPVVLDSVDISYSPFGYYKVKPYLHNMGKTVTITNASVRVVCDDPWVTSISSPVLNLSDISPGTTIKTSYNTNINVDSTFPGYFNFKVEIMSSGWVYWTDSIRIDIPVGVEEELLPVSYSLNQNYPNPFNPNTTIKYSIPYQSKVILKIYDILGNEIETLVNEEKLMGNYEVEFNGSGLASGIYFYQLRAESYVETKKMLLLK